jgi:hypothetical protein
MGLCPEMTWRTIALSALLLAACSPIPRDPEGTLDRVRAERLFRVGFISSGDRRDGGGREQAFVRRVAAATGAWPVVREGAAEPLLLELEEGRLDLVIGMVSPKSPWMKDVAILRPLGETSGESHLLLAPIARNGENAWIMLLEREARAIAAEAGGR